MREKKNFFLFSEGPSDVGWQFYFAKNLAHVTKNKRGSSKWVPPIYLKEDTPKVDQFPSRWPFDVGGNHLTSPRFEKKIGQTVLTVWRANWSL